MVDNFALPLTQERILYEYDVSLMKQNGYDVVMCDMDYTSDDYPGLASFMMVVARNLRLRNCTVPILGITKEKDIKKHKVSEASVYVCMCVCVYVLYCVCMCCVRPRFITY